jgi:hypothetical protein
VNQTELDLLGYAADEYIGHNIAEFHVDPAVIEDILRRLTNGETLRAYERASAQRMVQSVMSKSIQMFCGVTMRSFIRAASPATSRTVKQQMM